MMGWRSSDDENNEQDSKKRPSFSSSRKKKRRSRSNSPMRNYKKRDPRSGSRSRRQDRSVLESQESLLGSSVEDASVFIKRMPRERTEFALQKALANAKADDEDFSSKLSRNYSNPSLNFNTFGNETRTQLLESVESEGFVQSSFKSSRKQKGTSDINEKVTHEAAIFGSSNDIKTSIQSGSIETSSKDLFHEHLNEKVSFRWARWVKVLRQLRKKSFDSSK